MATYMLSTIDNPYNPFTDFTHWFLYDVHAGYNSCSRLARTANIKENMSEVEQQRAINDAVDDIVLHDPLNLYVRVKENGEGLPQSDNASTYVSS